MLPRSRFEWAVLWVVCLALGSAWIIYSREPAAAIDVASLPSGPLVGYAAPDFTATTPQGVTWRLNELRGKPVVLNFWASWCGPCRVEMPDFQAAARRYGGAVQFIGVNQGEDAQTITAFAAEMGVSYPLVRDESSQITDLYRVAALPSTFFIDSNGVVQDRVLGIVSGGVLQAKIDALLP